MPVLFDPQTLLEDELSSLLHIVLSAVIIKMNVLALLIIGCCTKSRDVLLLDKRSWRWTFAQVPNCRKNYSGEFKVRTI